MEPESDPEDHPDQVPLSTVQANNYLWKSPDGRSFPGWHHQLVLSLFAQDQQWRQEHDIDVSRIANRLVTEYPKYTMDDVSLRAIGDEYRILHPDTRMAYGRMVSELPSSREVTFSNPVPHMNLDEKMENSKWASILDPALFEANSSQQTSSLTPTSSNQRQLSDRDSIPEDGLLSASEGDNGTDVIGIDRSITRTDVSEQPQGLTNDVGPSNRESEYLKTPAKTVPDLKTPERPEHYRFSNRRSLSELAQPVSPLATQSSPISADEQFHDRQLPEVSQPIDKEIGRILFFSKAIYESKKEQIMDNSRSVKTSEAASEDHSDFLTRLTDDTENAEMRLPDPTKYVQTSRKHYTIPKSEAAAFVYWFEPKVDALPDKIEGYCWYCDQCYVDDNNIGNGAAIKGRFNQKRSIERHFNMAHNRVWKPVLPEPERKAGTNTKFVPEKGDVGADNIEQITRHEFELASDLDVSALEASEDIYPRRTLFADEMFSRKRKRSEAQLEVDEYGMIPTLIGIDRSQSSVTSRKRSFHHVNFADTNLVRVFEQEKPSIEFEDVVYANDEKPADNADEHVAKKFRTNE